MVRHGVEQGAALTRARRLVWLLRKRLRREAPKALERLSRARRRLHRVWQWRYRWTYARRLDRVPTRDELPALLNRRSLLGEGAEIGVKRGVFSEHLLRHWRGRLLISVDHWAGEHERHYEGAVARLGRFGERSQVWRLTSEAAAERVEDGRLDFVYIDAAHDAESVRRDLEAWFPKVRPGGIVAGHDYVPDRPGFEAKSAVDAFFGARGIPVHVTNGVVSLEIHPSWIVEVPG